MSWNETAMIGQLRPPPPPRPPSIGAILGRYVLGLVVLGGLSAAGLHYEAYKDAQLRTDLSTRGVRVAGSAYEHSNKGQSAKLRFQTLDGRAIVTTYDPWLSFPEFQKSPLGPVGAPYDQGSPVDVIYDPDNPSRALPAPFKTIPQTDPHAQFIALLLQFTPMIVMLAVAPIALMLASRFAK